MDELSLEIQGLKETQSALEKATAALTGPPMLAGMRRATLLVQGSAKRKSPVDTGRLRASITPEVQTRADGVVGIVGSNVKYAPFVELGTRRHFVPGRYIGGWAQRHGMFKGAKSVSINFGIMVSGKAQPFLQPAFEENAERIFQALGQAVSIIVTEAGNA
jgi:HK97 gp10 family phage protein